MNRATLLGHDTSPEGDEPAVADVPEEVLRVLVQLGHLLEHLVNLLPGQPVTSSWQISNSCCFWNNHVMK